jgi:hypothetical protein
MNTPKLNVIQKRPSLCFIVNFVLVTLDSVVEGGERLCWEVENQFPITELEFTFTFKCLHDKSSAGWEHKLLVRCLHIVCCFIRVDVKIIYDFELVMTSDSFLVINLDQLFTILVDDFYKV